MYSVEKASSRSGIENKEDGERKYLGKKSIIKNRKGGLSVTKT